MKTITFYFDYASPFSYLADKRLKEITANGKATIEYRPVLLGGIFQAAGNQAPMFEKCEPKREHGRRTLLRWISKLKAPLKMNPHFPIMTLQAMRACTAAVEAGQFEAFHGAMFKAMWEDGLDMGDVAEIAKVLDGAGLDGKALLESGNTAEMKDKLKAATAKAVEIGAFGVPTFVVDGEMYFGVDNLHFVEDILAEA